MKAYLMSALGYASSSFFPKPKSNVHFSNFPSLQELGFFGVPQKSTSFVIPTVHCLVELTEMPFTVISLSDIEIVNLERVGFNLKNFDMAIVFKVRRRRL